MEYRIERYDDDPSLPCATLETDDPAIAAQRLREWRRQTPADGIIMALGSVVIHCPPELKHEANKPAPVR